MATYLWLLIHLVLMSTISVSGTVFMSIDCGASGSYTDENSLFTWTGDDGLISDGVPHTVQDDFLTSHAYDTLRAFYTRKRNCYPIEVEKGEKVLVRASFSYGNYDNKQSPPTFDLHFDGNFWIQVNTTEAKFYEAIYVAKTSVISVCVSRIYEDQFPFISTLEVRSIDSEVYGGIDQNYALFTNLRIGYGLSETIRFPEDQYDRWWFSVNIGDDSGLVRLHANDASIINDNTRDSPPIAVLESAIAALDRDHVINLTLPMIEYPIGNSMYITWYFTEVEKLEPEDSYRSFEIYIDDYNFSTPIVPGYGNGSEYFVSNLSVTADTSFLIVSTNDSTLPPLINAMEIFSVSDVLTNGTNDNDVQGLDSLKNAFEVLKDWHGDPCLPARHSWDWIECNNDTRPRVTSINLNGYNLSGSLPDFRSMDALEIIDLHNNSLTGPVPDFLGNMLNLKQLNLADNQFVGSIPSSLSDNSQINLSDTGNHFSMTTSKKRKTSESLVILAITILAFFVF